jgi:glutaredoxin-related protein
LATEEDLNTLKKGCSDKAILILFWAEWDESSQTLKSMMEEMPSVYTSVRFAYVDCDESDLVETLDVDTVQTLVCVHPDGSDKKPDKYSGIKHEQLTEVVERENTFYKEWFESEKKKVFRDIEGHIGTFPFFAFIKGSKEEPKCKFTRRLVNELLGPKGYEYKTFNILADERVRQWLKVYTKWPTFPQIFINGKFAGGIDVVSELIEEGEFDDMVPESCKPLAPKDQVKKIL